MCCDRSRKTLRYSQSHQLKHDCAQGPLELDRERDAIDEPPLTCGANRVNEPFFH